MRTRSVVAACALLALSLPGAASAQRQRAIEVGGFGRYTIFPDTLGLDNVLRRAVVVSASSSCRTSRWRATPPSASPTARTSRSTRCATCRTRSTRRACCSTRRARPHELPHRRRLRLRCLRPSAHGSGPWRWTDGPARRSLLPDQPRHPARRGARPVRASRTRNAFPTRPSEHVRAELPGRPERVLPQQPRERHDPHGRRPRGHGRAARHDGRHGLP